MRMWMTDTEIMCDNHARGEYHELFMAVGCINKGISIDGYIRKGLIEVHSIIPRHAELVEEFNRRGWNSKPLPPFKVYRAGSIDREASSRELLSRCIECRLVYTEKVRERVLEEEK